MNTTLIRMYALPLTIFSFKENKVFKLCTAVWWHPILQILLQTHFCLISG